MAIVFLFVRKYQTGKGSSPFGTLVSSGRRRRNETNDGDEKRRDGGLGGEGLCCETNLVGRLLLLLLASPSLPRRPGPSPPRFSGAWRPAARSPAGLRSAAWWVERRMRRRGSPAGGGGSPRPELEEQKRGSVNGALPLELLSLEFQLPELLT